MGINNRHGNANVLKSKFEPENKTAPIRRGGGDVFCCFAEKESFLFHSVIEKIEPFDAHFLKKFHAFLSALIGVELGNEGYADGYLLRTHSRDEISEIVDHLRVVFARVGEVDPGI